MVLLINNTSLPALTIAALYKNRWQVELQASSTGHQQERREDADLVRRETEVSCALQPIDPGRTHSPPLTN